MTNKQKIGLLFGIAAVGTGVFLWFKTQAPKFKILDLNQHDQTVKWQYGKITNVAQVGLNNTYSSTPNSDFYVNVASIEEDGKTVGFRFNFLGKDGREPHFVYFE